MPPTPIVRQNGNALRAFREIRGLSVIDLARRAGVSPPALRNWELENRALPRVKAERVCGVLSIPVDAIDRDTRAQASVPQAAAS
jgi:transcriptional regulator with XRE-family HTH domain